MPSPRSSRPRASSDRVLGLLGSAVRDGAFPVTPDQRSAAGGRTGRAGSPMRCGSSGLCSTCSTSSTASRCPAWCSRGWRSRTPRYPDPSARVFGDVDVLIAPGRLNRAAAGRSSQRSYGARAEPELRPGFDDRFGREAMVRVRSIEVDLHRTFVNGAYGMRIDLEPSSTSPTRDRRSAGVRVRGARSRRSADARGLRIDALRLATPARRLPGPGPDASPGDAGPRPPRCSLGPPTGAAEAVLAAGIRDAWRALRLTDRPALLDWAETLPAEHAPTALLLAARAGSRPRVHQPAHVGARDPRVSAPGRIPPGDRPARPGSTATPGTSGASGCSAPGLGGPGAADQAPHEVVELARRRGVVDGQVGGGVAHVVVDGGTHQSTSGCARHRSSSEPGAQRLAGPARGDGLSTRRTASRSVKARRHTDGSEHHRFPHVQPLHPQHEVGAGEQPTVDPRLSWPPDRESKLGDGDDRRAAWPGARLAEARALHHDRRAARSLAPRVRAALRRAASGSGWRCTGRATRSGRVGGIASDPRIAFGCGRGGQTRGGTLRRRRRAHHHEHESHADCRERGEHVRFGVGAGAGQRRAECRPVTRTTSVPPLPMHGNVA